MELNEPPVFLNFEDPQDVARIKSELGSEPGAAVARRPSPAGEIPNR